MRVTSKGQVTIPKDVRKRLGIRPGSEVDFKLDESGARLVRARTRKGEDAVERMIGRGTVKMTTDEILALTRGED
jgi:antitoxin PrlF